MHDALAGLHILEPQQAEFFPTHAIEQGGEGSPISHRLQCVQDRVSKSFQACAPPRAGVLPSLLLKRTLHEIDGSAEDCVALAEIVKQ
jgi:hypothetical protein